MDLIVTVRDILKAKEFDNCKVLAGEDGLDRQIQRVTVLELPDAPDWISGGELVCSTQYHFQGNPQAQLKWFSDMNKYGVAAIAVKPQRFLGEMPQSVIDFANEVGLPIIELTNDIRWPSIIWCVMDKLLNIQSNQLRESYDIHNQLVRLVLESGGLPTILKAIAKIASASVILEDRYFNTIAYEIADKPSQIAYVNFRLEQANKKELKQYFGGQLPIESSVIYHPLVPAPGTNEAVTQAIFPVIAGDHSFGWLTLLPVERKNNVFIETVLMQGAVAVALQMLVHMNSFQHRSHEMSAFFEMLTNDNYVSPTMIKQLGAAININWSLPMIVFVLLPRPEFTIHNYHQIEESIHAVHPEAIIDYNPDRITLICSQGDQNNEKKALTESKKIAKNIIDATSGFERICNIGIGSMTTPNPNSIRNSFHEALSCARLAAEMNVDFCTYTQLGLERIMPFMFNQDDLTAFLNRTLQPLIDYDKKKNTDLIKTLNVYFNNEFNKAQTATALNIHINTLTYRLSKIESLLDTTFNDMDTNLLLYLALRLQGQS